LNTFKTAYPLEKFVTHEFPVDQVDEAMAQAFDIDACMKVVLTPSGG
jgi:threonine dehydrogenase-like Zn-dependent dehydrogenase